jgi:hypothetical protein
MENDKKEQLVFYKENENDTIFWVDNPETVGVWLFTFDKKNIFNMFSDYPYKLTKQQKEIFDKENPYWADFFKDRK